jgi:predicted nucleic acid-binding protein
MRVVIDASVVVKWFLPEPGVEPHADRALSVLEQLRQGALRPLQPVHWLAEVAAVINRLRPGLVEHALDLLDAMALPVVNEPSVYRTACSLGARLGQHVFDTLYHAVALERDATLVTADLRYARKARRLGHLVPLGQWATAAGR